MRKVLSFVLVLTLVLSSFSMAFAGTEAQAKLSDIAGNANEEAITVNFNLGIIDGMGDGTFAPDQAVTRAQFAAMMTRALAVPDSALAGYTATSFKDTTGYGWAVPYLAFCQSKGILVGDGAGNVMPGKTVSVNEAMTMVLRAIGYTNNSAALVGVWPANYVSLAQNNSLYDDVASATGVTRANAAQIIYNALTVDKVEVAADGTTKVLTGKSMLTTGLNCEAVEDYVVQGNEDSLISLKAYVGQKVTIYKNSDGDIIAIAGVDSTAITGSFSVDTALQTTNDAIKLTLNNAKFVEDNDDDTEYTVKDTVFANYFVNGKDTTPTTAAIGDPITSTSSVTINAKVVGKEIREIYSITAWNIDAHKKVAKSDINTLSDDRLLGYDFDTLKNGDINTNSFTLVGVSSLDKIAVDNVVYVYSDGDYITKVEVGTEVVKGEVDKVKSNGDFLVGGKTYSLADVSTATTPDAGDDVVLYLDASGDVYKITNNTGNTDKYAVVVANDPLYDKVKLYTTDDESKWFEHKTGTDYAEVEASVLLTGKLVGYSLNNSGVVDGMTNAGFVAGNATLEAINLIKIGSLKYNVDSDCVVYVSKSGIVDGVKKIGDVRTEETLGGVQAIVDDGDVVALFVDAAKADKSSDDTYAVIDAVASVKNADGDSVQQITGWANGAALDKLTSDKNIANDPKANTAPALWKIKFNSDGAVNSVSQMAVKGGANSTVSAISNDGATLTVVGTNADTYALAKDAIVYRAVIKDGDVDSYSLSDMGSINVGNFIYLFDTDDTDSPGYEVAIYVTKF